MQGGEAPLPRWRVRRRVAGWAKRYPKTVRYEYAILPSAPFSDCAQFRRKVKASCKGRLHISRGRGLGEYPGAKTERLKIGKARFLYQFDRAKMRRSPVGRRGARRVKKKKKGVYPLHASVQSAVSVTRPFAHLTTPRNSLKSASYSSSIVQLVAWCSAAKSSIHACTGDSNFRRHAAP